MKEIDELIEIMDTLRGENGCNWDKKQTHETLIPFLIEETYEVVDALESKDFNHLKEELGDLLFQVVFHARLTKENSLFEFKDVAKEISEKLIRRHPHIFSNPENLPADQVLTNWDKIKKAEKAEKGVIHDSILDGVPKALPALQRSEDIQKKAAKVGFDWEKVEDVFEKIQEEMGELKEEIHVEEQNKERIEEEMGDLLFSVVNLSRFLKISPEVALRKANQKFETRFRKLEKILNSEYGGFENRSLEEMDRVWEMVKTEE
ncbi:MAG: nucleoside triphosphate pyrophosphohydrolase [Leptospiraceae bacterium]|nr:nucleoside triphosphate pyrophosphohydrolase [Leptospiraceae bacterium]